MDSYIVIDDSKETKVSFEEQSYFQIDERYRTEIGVPECDEVPILQGDDDIFSGINLNEEGVAYKKAIEFVVEFTRVFYREKTPDRAYSKFVQNQNELPDVELDWIFQYFRVSLLFSNSINDEDYYCITKFDEGNKKYDSTSGILKKESYKEIAEEVMRKVK